MGVMKRRFRKMNARKNFTKRRFIFLKQPFVAMTSRLSLTN